jgi:serine protease Do
MNWRFLIFIAGFCSLIVGLATQVLALEKSIGFKVLESNSSALGSNFNIIKDNYLKQSQSSDRTRAARTALPSIEQLQQKSRSITVKIISGETWGSGILIQKQGEVYTVVTNQHVLIGETKPYQIETPDGQLHQAEKLEIGEFGDRDLGILQFTSKECYSVVSLSPVAKPILGEAVFAAGFPFEEASSQLSKFSFTSGTISTIAEKNFAGGYQIGYTNDVRKGMSGGPLLNRRGEIIGINGVHKYPLWGNPYVFQDGSVASGAMQEKMSQLSWAIPVETLLRLAPQFATTEKSLLTFKLTFRRCDDKILSF